MFFFKIVRGFSEIERVGRVTDDFGLPLGLGEKSQFGYAHLQFPFNLVSMTRVEEQRARRSVGALP